MPVVSTFRTDLRSAVASLLTNFQAAHPTYLRQTFRTRPRSMHPPLAYVGHIREATIVHSQSLRTRQPNIDIVIVQGLYDQAETYNAQDIAVDAMLDYISNNPHAVSGATLIEPVSTEDIDLTITGDGGKSSTYLATVITVATDTQEGLD